MHVWKLWRNSTPHAFNFTWLGQAENDLYQLLNIKAMKCQAMLSFRQRYASTRHGRRVVWHHVHAIHCFACAFSYLEDEFEKQEQNLRCLPHDLLAWCLGRKWSMRFGDWYLHDTSGAQVVLFATIFRAAPKLMISKKWKLGCDCTCRVYYFKAKCIFYKFSAYSASLVPKSE